MTSQYAVKGCNKQNSTSKCLRLANLNYSGTVSAFLAMRLPSLVLVVTLKEGWLDDQERPGMSGICTYEFV